jgi:hypothetical protein
MPGLKRARPATETLRVEPPKQREGKPMSAKPPKHSLSRDDVDARKVAPAPQAKRRSLGWVRAVLGRSIKIEQRKNQLHVALVDPKREREPQPDKTMSLVAQQRAELSARLLVHDPATQAVRHLFIVLDELRIGGWEKVEALPLKVIDRALTEAEILDSEDPSPMLTTIIAELRDLKVAAEMRAAQEAAEAEWGKPLVPEVSDTNFDEYELMERSWAGTIPAGLELPSRDTTM